MSWKEKPDMSSGKMLVKMAALLAILVLIAPRAGR